MKVELLHATPIEIVIKAIRKCYESEALSDGGEKDSALIKRIIASGHTSTIEHITFSFNIEGISRACLQELARHRHASLSVKSTRYTLGKIKNEDWPFTSAAGLPVVDKYLVKTGNEYVDYNSTVQLEEVRQGAINGIANDQLKFMLPESFKTSLVWTINARSLRNFLELRLSPRALWEIRKLAQEILDGIPHKYSLLFEDIVEAQHTN